MSLKNLSLFSTLALALCSATSYAGPAERAVVHVADCGLLGGVVVASNVVANSSATTTAAKTVDGMLLVWLARQAAADELVTQVNDLADRNIIANSAIAQKVQKIARKFFRDRNSSPSTAAEWLKELQEQSGRFNRGKDAMMSALSAECAP